MLYKFNTNFYFNILTKKLFLNTDSTIFECYFFNLKINIIDAKYYNYRESYAKMWIFAIENGNISVPYFQTERIHKFKAKKEELKIFVEKKWKTFRAVRSKQIVLKGKHIFSLKFFLNIRETHTEYRIRIYLPNAIFRECIPANFSFIAYYAQ